MKQPIQITNKDLKNPTLNLTLVNITGATELVSNVFVRSFSFVKESLVDLDDMPALFRMTFRPSSLTISSILSTSVSKLL